MYSTLNALNTTFYVELTHFSYEEFNVLIQKLVKENNPFPRVRSDREVDYYYALETVTIFPIPNQTFYLLKSRIVSTSAKIVKIVSLQILEIKVMLYLLRCLN